MADVERDGISDDLLNSANARIDELLNNKRLPKTERVMLETQQYFLMFLRSDHKKINEMYPVYMEQRKKNERLLLLNNAIILFLATDVVSRVIGYLTK